MREPFRVGHLALQRYRTGPLGGYIDRFAAWLQERQYARQAARHMIRVVADLSLWLQRRRLGVESLNEQTVAKFFHRRRRYDPTRRGDRAAVRALLDLLRDRNPTPRPPRKEPAGPSHPIERDFALYLKQERRLSPATLLNTLPFVKSFLAARFGQGPVSLQEVRPADIHQFVLRHANSPSPARAQIMVGALRSFFRFLHLKGEIASDLAAAVPTVAAWRLSTVPRSIAPEQVERLLKSCDRRTATGRRDYAVLLLLARLGLRAGEVTALTLDDIDWTAGEITVRGKGTRRDRLPLPQDVGKALVAYLRAGRPRCATRQVFLTARAPIRRLADHRTVGAIVQRCLERAGIRSAHKGAHLLRHSLAVRMLRYGASLAEIGEILRHRLPDTTAIYAKVDLTALRALAQPWPGGEA